MGRRLLIAISLATCILSSCTAPPRQFDSREWRSGNPSSRGAQVQDLIDRKILLGKAPSDVQALLGEPDYHENDWYGYKVVTIARCRFWECRMDVVFDRDTNSVKSVAVSD